MQYSENTVPGPCENCSIPLGVVRFFPCQSLLLTEWQGNYILSCASILRDRRSTSPVQEIYR